MDLQLNDRIVVVTGASKGIGWACAEAFAHAGAKVVLVSRSQANLDAALARWPKSAPPPVAIAADLTRAEEAERMAATAEENVGPVAILVNSAGAARRYAPADLDAAAWHDAMDAKFFSYIHAIDAVLKRMLGTSAGRRGERSADAGDGGPRRSVRAEGHSRKRHQSRGNADRTSAGRPESRVEDDRVDRGRAARAQSGTNPARQARHARRSRAGRPVPGLRPGKLRHRRHRADGRRQRRGDLAASGAPPHGAT